MMTASKVFQFFDDVNPPRDSEGNYEHGLTLPVAIPITDTDAGLKGIKLPLMAAKTYEAGTVRQVDPFFTQPEGFMYLDFSTGITMFADLVIKHTVSGRTFHQRRPYELRVGNGITATIPLTVYGSISVVPESISTDAESEIEAWLDVYATNKQMTRIAANLTDVHSNNIQLHFYQFYKETEAPLASVTLPDNELNDNLKSKLKAAFDKIATKTGAMRSLRLTQQGDPTYDPATARVSRADDTVTSFRGIISDISEKDYIEGIDVSAGDRKLLTLRPEVLPETNDIVDDGDDRYLIKHVTFDPARQTNTSYLEIDRRAA